MIQLKVISKRILLNSKPDNILLNEIINVISYGSIKSNQPIDYFKNNQQMNIIKWNH